MPYVAIIRENSSGEIRRCQQDGLDWHEGNDGNSYWWWTDGNFGCDCNRRDAFYNRTYGDDAGEDSPCGDSAYDVLAIELRDRSVLIDALGRVEERT